MKIIFLQGRDHLYGGLFSQIFRFSEGKKNNAHERYKAFSRRLLKLRNELGKEETEFRRDRIPDKTVVFNKKQEILWPIEKNIQNKGQVISPKRGE